jgi:hypothetical protein
MGEAEVWLGRFEVLEKFSRWFGFPEISAQNGIDESGLGAEAGLAGQLDRLVDRGVIGDAVEPEDLVKAELEQMLERTFLGAILRFAGNKPVEGLLPADDAVNQLLAEAPVRGRQGRAGQRIFEQILDKCAAALPLTQDAGRNFSWIFSAHNL